MAPSERSSTRSLVLVLALVTTVVFSLTAEWGVEQNVDAVAAGLAARQVAESGSLVLDDHASANPWVVEGPVGLVSNRPPGVWGLAVPAFVAARPFTDDGLAFWPATLTALAASVAATVLLFVVLNRVVARHIAFGGAMLFAFGTATWPISAAQLWPHGPLALWLALGLLAWSSDRLVSAGMTDAIAVLARPPTAVVPAVRGLWAAVQRRSLAPAVRVGLPAAAGLSLLVLYNRFVHGSWSLTGGYQDLFRENLAGMSPVEWLGNVWSMTAGPNHGVLVWSPFLLVLLPGLPRAWRKATPWIRSSAVAGLVYTVVHGRLNRASGGLAFDYRYQLELLMLAAPLLALAYTEWVAPKRVRVRAFWLAAIVAVVLQALNAVAVQCDPVSATQVSCEFRL